MQVRDRRMRERLHVGIPGASEVRMGAVDAGVDHGPADAFARRRVRSDCGVSLDGGHRAVDQRRNRKIRPELVDDAIGSPVTLFIRANQRPPLIDTDPAPVVGLRDQHGRMCVPGLSQHVLAELLELDPRELQPLLVCEAQLEHVPAGLVRLPRKRPSFALIGIVQRRRDDGAAVNGAAAHGASGLTRAGGCFRGRRRATVGLVCAFGRVRILAVVHPSSCCFIEGRAVVLSRPSRVTTLILARNVPVPRHPAFFRQRKTRCRA